MYFSASKQGVVFFFNGIPNQWNSGAREQNPCSRGLLFLPSSEHLRSERSKTKQNIPTHIMQGEGNILDFCFLFFYKVEVFQDAICEVQTKT